MQAPILKRLINFISFTTLCIQTTATIPVDMCVENICLYYVLPHMDQFVIRRVAKRALVGGGYVKMFEVSCLHVAVVQNYNTPDCGDCVMN